MTKLSVNINKIATIRNARGGMLPNVPLAAQRCEQFGADGITVHPRPDGRHITYTDVREIKPLVTTEFNIEGYPNSSFLDLVKEVKPHQVTLVPDAPDAITSNAGWDTIKYESMLADIISDLKSCGIRTSIFVDTELKHIEGAAKINTDRIELYTESYATEFSSDKFLAIAPFIEAAKLAHESGLGINAGHDLSLDNIEFFKQNIPNLAEVSIGHALISESLYLGLQNVVNMYLHRLQ